VYVSTAFILCQWAAKILFWRWSKKNPSL